MSEQKIVLPIEYVDAKPIVPMDGSRKRRRERPAPDLSSPAAQARARVAALEAERASLPGAIADAMLADDYTEVTRLQQRAIAGAIETQQAQAIYLAHRRNEAQRAYQAQRALVPAARARVAAARVLVREAEEARDVVAAELGMIEADQSAQRDLVRSFDKQIFELNGLDRIVPWPVGSALQAVAAQVSATVEESAQDRERQSRRAHRRAAREQADLEYQQQEAAWLASRQTAMAAGLYADAGAET